MWMLISNPHFLTTSLLPSQRLPWDVVWEGREETGQRDGRIGAVQTQESGRDGGRGCLLILTYKICHQVLSSVQGLKVLCGTGD